MNRIVTIDGPAGVGKSTLARQVAEYLEIAYLDTGAMFRIVSYHLGQAGLDLPQAEMATKLDIFKFSLSGSGNDTTLACNGHVAGKEIRTEEVGMLASRYGTLPAIRAFLKTAQQDLGKQYSLVAEGRDMGTTVFPDAPSKFFLDATPEVRALRRVRQLAANGINEDVDHVARQIRERDEQDRNRALAPLKPAADAVIIDTSEYTIKQVFDAIVANIL